MSIPSARLLAHLCCTCLLLLSVICIISANPTKITPTTAARVDFENNSSKFDLSLKKDKCQYNLTDSNQSLEATSSIYQHLGFSKCEYIIQASSSHFLLLSFTDIHSHSVMPLETSVRHQDLLQAATETTSPVTESVFAKTSLNNPLSHKKVNSSTIHLNRELGSTTADISEDIDFLHLSNLHNKSQHNISLPYSGSNSNSHTGNLVHNKTVSDSHSEEHITSKGNIANSYKDSERLSDTVVDSDFKFTTASELSHIDIHTEPRVPNCSLKFIIEEVNNPSGSTPQVICWEKSWQHRIPLVFQYSVPIRITYVWDRHSQSGFSIDFRFFRPEAEVDCHFRCNSYLCLPKKQLCDGYSDCPDHSDEHSSTCAQARQQQESGEPHMIYLIVIILAVILEIILVPIIIFMISHIHCRHGACRRGDSLLQPPHSQSSEVYRSPSGSMQESGHYETLLHQHPQRQTTVPSLMVPNSWCMERQQLLQQQHQEPDAGQYQQHHQLLSLNHHKRQVHQLCPLNLKAEAVVTSAASMVSDSLKYRHQQLLTHHQQKDSEQHLQQQRKHRHVLRHEHPDELYPPNIPLSADGEEGYAMSQKVLHSKQQLERNRQVENEVFRPPPNKTIYDRDSPPPPYSHSPPGTNLLDSHYPSVGVVSVLRQARSTLTSQASPAGVSQSHSLSCHH